MANILITGGAGYIGSVLVPLLLQKGHRVTVLDSFLYEQATLLDCCSCESLEIVRGDCRDESVLRAILPGKEFILPLAALVGYPACLKDRTAAASTNLQAVESIMRLRSPEQKVIFPSTNSGYGTHGTVSFCTEESPIQPISLYGKLKMQAEAAVLKAGSSTVFRFATLFGASPRMRTDLLVNDFVYRAVYDRSVVVFEGHFKRNYLHVRDAAAAFLFAIDHFGAMNGEVFNCGMSNANLSKLELCEEIRKQLPHFVYLEAPIGRDPDQRNYIVSNRKIEALGYRTAYSLEDGIKELIKCYSIIKNTKYGNG